ncbi:2-hydroxyacid dehydrogenase [Faunimonas sp. B44]|uniref:2-hydroxyacid dehydrogenase n=1 Tax=Faunimonas sp. B44 TaxID=3461493 RepID=UPI004044963F
MANRPASPNAREASIRPAILITKPLDADCVSALEARFEVHSLVGDAEPEAVLAAHGGEVRGIAGGKVAGALMRRLPRLEIIANSGVGVDTNDLETAKELGIVITNTPDVLNDAVAELTVALMLGLARALPRADRFVRDGAWERGDFPLGSELRGKTVGIVGLGRIGKEIAARLAAMKMDVRYFGRHEQTGQPYRYHGNLVAMAADSDWLVVIAPANASTDGLVGREAMQALGPEGRLVNVARGSLVDQPAMIELLRSGELGGAALDVVDGEPRVPEVLLSLPNVVVSPHMGSRTLEARRDMGRLVVANLVAHFDGRRPPNRVH